MSYYKLALKEIAKIVSRRGQTIHGRKKIVDLQAKAGVSLLEESEIEEGRESLEIFLTLYAKLGPASRLTLLIYAKQYGIDLPEKVLGKKKKTLLDHLRPLTDLLQ